MVEPNKKENPALPGALVMRELLQLIFSDSKRRMDCFKTYFLDSENLLELSVYGGSACVLALPFFPAATIMGELSALMVLGAWIICFLTFSRYSFGIYISMFLKLCARLVYIVGQIFLPLVLACGVAFHILLDKNVFNYFVSSFLKALVMMMGELEFEGQFKNDELSATSVISQGIFVAFIFAITIVAQNLIVGVAVNITEELQDEVYIQNSKLQMQQVGEVERFLLKCLGKWDGLKKRIMAFSAMGELAKEASIKTTNQRVGFSVRADEVTIEEGNNLIGNHEELGQTDVADREQAAFKVCFFPHKTDQSIRNMTKFSIENWHTLYLYDEENQKDGRKVPWAMLSSTIAKR